MSLDPKKLKVTELRAELKERGLNTKGLKATLVQRLTEALEDEEEEVPKKKKTTTKRGRKRKVEPEPEGEDEDEEESDEEEPPKKRQKKASTGKAKVDPEALAGGVGSDAEVVGEYACMLNQTNIKNNNNKFYVIQVINDGGNYYYFTRWGRVGEKGQKKMQYQSKETAIKSFKKQFRAKTKNSWDDRENFSPVPGKYTLLEMDYNDDDEEDLEELQKLSKQHKGKVKVKECTLAKPTQDFIKLIFDNDMFKTALKSFNIDIKKMPLGKISKAQLDKGFAVLEDIEDEIKGGGDRATLNELTSEFYTNVPHAFGRSRPPPIADLEELQKKYDLLSTLGDIAMAVKKLKGMTKEEKGEGVKEVPHPLDVKYQSLNTDLVPVKKASKEWNTLNNYVHATRSDLVVLDIWEMDRKGSSTRFEKFDHLENRKLLWHGTNVAVIVAIMSSGLRIMPHAGGRVGRGLYFASENSKSAGYVRCAGNIGFMFLTEVALGKSKEITRDDSSLVKAPPGFESVLAQGRTEPDPSSDIEWEFDGHTVTLPIGKAKPRNQFKSSYFTQSEYLVYNEGQAKLRYIFKIKFSRGW